MIMIMKKILMVSGAVLLLSAFTSKAEKPDTLVNITDATTLLITESPSGVSVKVAKDSAADSLTEVLNRSLEGDVVVRQKRWHSPFRDDVFSSRSKWDLKIGGPAIGWVNAVGAPDGMDIEMGKSLEISWLNMLAVTYSPWKMSELSIGFGFDWRNYRISTSQTRFITTDAGTIAVDAYPEGTKGHGSRLKVFSMGIPVMWRQWMPWNRLDGTRMSIGVGAVFNYNSHGSLLTKWTEADGRKAEQKTNHIGQRRFTVDLIGTVSVGWGLSLYVRYSPNTVLRGAGQPKFRPFSTGIGYLF